MCVSLFRKVRWAAGALFALAVLSLCLPQRAKAADLQLDISLGSITITATGYTQGANSGPAASHYAISGSSTTNTVHIDGANCTVELNGASISLPTMAVANATNPWTVCAFAVGGNADVTLTLSGNNLLKSADNSGMAGLFVEAGSKLTIDGSGSLQATGAKGKTSAPIAAGGAGIGGNGHNANYRAAAGVFGSGTLGSGHFGEIAIDSGSITATGGIATNSNYGAGAGIGSGGLSGSVAIKAGGIIDTDTFPEGSIAINGGTIVAEGGKGGSQSADTLGGAGIGSGGVGNYWDPMHNYIDVAIHGGTVTAQAYSDGAGIGGGANANSATVLIDGNADVKAYGGDELDGTPWGGAGIGGGDNGCAPDIAIGGQAKVLAVGKGAAAGIGGGGDGGVLLWEPGDQGEWKADGRIRIYGDADVTAFAGPYVHASNPARGGGAGIGAGRSAYFFNPGGAISFEDNAFVTAYSGKHAQAVGAGCAYDFSVPLTNSLHLDSTVSIHLFNWNDTVAAYPDSPTGSGASSIVAFTRADSGLASFPAQGSVEDTTTGSYKWSYTGGPGNYVLDILESDGTTQKTSVTSAHQHFGNWAILLPPQTYTVTYLPGADDVTGTVSDPNAYLAGASVPIQANAFVRTGYQFAGFAIANDPNVYAASADDVPSALHSYTMGNANVTFTAQWVPLPPSTYTLTVIDGTGGGSYAAGTVVEISAVTPSAGMVFDHWESNAGGLIGDIHSTTTSFTMPANHVTLTAVFRPSPEVTPSHGGGGNSGNPNPPGDNTGNGGGGNGSGALLPAGKPFVKPPDSPGLPGWPGVVYPIEMIHVRDGAFEVAVPATDAQPRMIGAIALATLATLSTVVTIRTRKKDR